jgi:alpha-1,3-fucosyltransferase
LRKNIIPIVYGAANYNQFAPPKSYIDVNDFKSVEDLAIFLSFLSQNPKEYIKYFWWKRYYKVVNPNPFCDLCMILHNKDVSERKQVYGNIKRYVVFVF